MFNLFIDVYCYILFSWVDLLPLLFHFWTCVLALVTSKLRSRGCFLSSWEAWICRKVSREWSWNHLAIWIHWNCFGSFPKSILWNCFLILVCWRVVEPNDVVRQAYLQNMSLLSVLRTDMNLPRRLQHLTFGFNFNHCLVNLNLPSTLQSLTLGFHYNQSLEDVTLPSGLESLTFGQSFNQSLDRVTWRRQRICCKCW